MQINPYTGYRDPFLRASNAGVVVRMSLPAAEAVSFAQDRGYLPQVGVMRYRDDGASLRIARSDAYAWAEAVAEDEAAFGSCLERGLFDRILGAHVIITNRWAV